MTNELHPAAWRVITGTARGAAHDARSLPNQDSAGSLALAQADGIVVAVADGHGHERHFRSGTGSELAVGAACSVVAELAAGAGGQPWSPEVATALRDQLPELIVARWREAVARDVEAHPYSAAQLSVLEQTGDDQGIPYGSTLIVALIVGDWLVCAQIGDGDLLAVRPDGGAWSPVSGDELLDGYRTTSLCQPAAVSAFRVAAYDLRATSLLALLLSTDGYGNAQAKELWQPLVARDIAELAVSHDADWFAGQLPAWAARCASAAGSADDTTIALLLAPDSERLAAAARPAATQELTVGRSLTAEVTRPAPRFSRRRAVAAGVAVAAAAAITAAVVMSQSPGSAQRPPALQPTGQPAPRATPSPSDAGRAPASTAPAPASQTGPQSVGGSAPAPHDTSTRQAGATSGNPAGNQG